MIGRIAVFERIGKNSVLLYTDTGAYENKINFSGRHLAKPKTIEGLIWAISRDFG